MRRSSWLICFLAIALASTVVTSTNAQTEYSLQVGAQGDYASRRNMGVGAEIRTRIHSMFDPELSYSFWVGDNLDNGAFIQFGYQLSSPSRYCLCGEVIGEHANCQGSSDKIGYCDARWFWQYWPNPYAVDFYYGIGPANSAGAEGDWHLYQILPNVANGWTFVLDDQPVSSINEFQWTTSKDPAFVVAEEVTSVPYAGGTLGPVEFRKLSYYKQDGWHQVKSLYAISGCGVMNPNCNIEIPYGVTTMGSNHIIAGTGEQVRSNSDLLWTEARLLSLKLPFGIQAVVDGLSYSGTVELPLSPGLHTVSVQSYLQIDGTSRLKFAAWSDGSPASSRTMDLNSDTRLEAVYVPQYRLTIVSTYPVSGDGWYDQGSVAHFSTFSTPQLTLTSIEVFEGWYDNGVMLSNSVLSTISMDKPHTLQAVWRTYSTLPAIVIVLCIVGLLYLRRILVDAVEDQDADSEQTQLEPIPMQSPVGVQSTVVDKLTLCPYCDGKIPRGAKRCPDCGISTYIRYLSK